MIRRHSLVNLVAFAVRDSALLRSSQRPYLRGRRSDTAGSPSPNGSMRRRFRSPWLVASAAVLLVAVPAVPTVATAQPFTSVTYFGDSFTDTGNGDILAGLLGVPDLTPTPPYFPGRASNG